MLEGGLAKFKVYLPFVVVALTVSSFFYLEYLFTRAVAGLTLLIIKFLLHDAFAAGAPIPLRATLAILFFALAICAMFMLGTPWRFRDLIRKAIEDKKRRAQVAAFVGACGLIALVTGLVTLSAQ